MTPERQAQCGGLIQRLSGMLHDMAADPKQEKISQRQLTLQELKKEWACRRKDRRWDGH